MNIDLPTEHTKIVKQYVVIVSAMFDIDAPCNAVELHLLCKILDIYCEKDIDYTMLHDGLGCIRCTAHTMLQSTSRAWLDTGLNLPKEHIQIYEDFMQHMD